MATQLEESKLIQCASTLDGAFANLEFLEKYANDVIARSCALSKGHRIVTEPNLWYFTVRSEGATAAEAVRNATRAVIAHVGTRTLHGDVTGKLTCHFAYNHAVSRYEISYVIIV